MLPATVIRCFCGWISGLDTLMMALFYSLVWFCVTSIGFCVEQFKVIRKGVTTFEEDNNIKVTNINSLEDNLRGVFGDKWWLNFLVPLHVIYPPSDDGIVWTNVKI